MMKTLGIILMAICCGFNYVTKEKVANLEPIEITKDNQRAVVDSVSLYSCAQC